MDRVDALRAFVAAADLGGLSAAARALGRSPASLTRAVASVEEHAGAVLMQRTTRSLKLTDAGARYLAVARRVLADLDEADRTASETDSPRGVLSVTAPLTFGAVHVRPIVEAYLAAYEGVRVRLTLLDRVVDLVTEGMDVAVRLAHLPDSSLIAVPLGNVRRVVVASPAYLAKHGRPRSPADLASHRCVAATAITPSDTWTFQRKRVHVAPVLSVNIVDAAVRAAIAGTGVTCAMSYQVASELRSGRLVRLLASYEPPPLPAHLVFPAASSRTAKVRAFVDMATPRLRALLSPRQASARKN
jgi:DNA-binding transcriptional LysR family regulator